MRKPTETDRRIRRAIADTMSAQGITQQVLADRLETTQGHVGQIIRAERGKVPASLTELLDALGLELVIRPKG